MIGAMRDRLTVALVKVERWARTAPNVNDRLKARALAYLEQQRQTNAGRALGLDTTPAGRRRPATVPLSDAATMGGLPNSGVDRIVNAGTCGSCGGPILLDRRRLQASCPCGDTVLPTRLLTGRDDG